MDLLLPIIAAFVVAYILLDFLQPMAKRIGLVDEPDHRKHHEGTVPLIGGVAMLIGLMVGACFIERLYTEWLGFLTGAMLLVVVGVLDDLYELKTAYRFAIQIIAVLLVCLWDGVVIDNLGNLLGFGDITLGSLSIPFTIFAVVGVINAVNMSDGLDGLAGGFMLVVLIAIGVFDAIAGGSSVGLVSWLLAGVVVAFLRYNIPVTQLINKRVFMGDAGSMFLGFTVAWLLIRLSQVPDSLFDPVMALWLMALPLMDTIAIIIRRVNKGSSPFLPDREHFHHIILLAGYSVRQTVFMLLSLAIAMVAIGAIAWFLGVPEPLFFYAFLTLFALYYWGISHSWKVMKAVRQIHNGPE
ncbi:Undecaprenyl-phosphate alpha-N-acetylglucosaminyl 1-phosphate transferase [hydrothermal vent metagenome]|uniref:Undecaprenyl-phosphate alpha-N-acetylglucosaminyl 1-phosphate transferase n=1 Tax=hydrothermal vent metagenome TaxID=652676 RepID=A0A3B1BH64_9ZZZZ